jgi:hypothetical protein
VPIEAMATLRAMRGDYGEKIWKRYGFVDAFNPMTGWADTDVIGIDLGISMLQAENLRTGLLWKVFGQAPEVRRALQRAGFVSQRRDLAPADREYWLKVAVQSWQSIEAEPAGVDSAGLGLSAVLCAETLGLIDHTEATARLGARLRTTPAPVDEQALGIYAASLVAVRQAFPGFAADATRRLSEIDWKNVRTGSNELGSASRLTAFFQIATGAKPVTAWTNLDRKSEAMGTVRVLTPGQVFGNLVPGLWLDERAIVTGASSAQLAYAIAIGQRQESVATFPYDVADTALLIDQFPVALSARVQLAPLPGDWLQRALPANRSLLFLSLANLLSTDCLRIWFQPGFPRLA